MLACTLSLSPLPVLRILPPLSLSRPGPSRRINGPRRSINNLLLRRLRRPQRRADNNGPGNKRKPWTDEGRRPGGIMHQGKQSGCPAASHNIEQPPIREAETVSMRRETRSASLGARKKKFRWRHGKRGRTPACVTALGATSGCITCVYLGWERSL